MAHREPLDEQEPTIGKLVVDAFDDFGTLVRHMIELAKSELKVSVRAGGMAIALFALAGFLGLLAIIMISIAIAFFIHMAGLDLAWCFLIVFGAYVLLAALLGLIGYRKVRKVNAILPEAIDWDRDLPPPLKPEDLGSNPSDGAGFDSLPGFAMNAANYKQVEKEFAEWLYRNERAEIFSCPSLKEYSQLGESEAEFRARLSQKAREARDAAVEKLRDATKKKLTTAAGAPVPDNQNTLTAGLRGPVLLQDVWLLEKLGHFHREVIPERRMHAKGSGAYGTFTVTQDITRYTRAKLFSKVGKKTDLFTRFTTVAGERGGGGAPGSASAAAKRSSTASAAADPATRAARVGIKRYFREFLM